MILVAPSTVVIARNRRGREGPKQSTTGTVLAGGLLHGVDATSAIATAAGGDPEVIEMPAEGSQRLQQTLIKAGIVCQFPRRLLEIVMKRRLFLAGVLIPITGVYKQAASNAGRVNMLDGAPEKIRLIPDEWHIEHVGHLVDGRLYWVDGQLDSAGGATKDFICTFIFDHDGRLLEHSIELIGVRGSYLEASVATAIDRHIAALGDRIATDIWVRPFSVKSHGTVFGLIPRQTEGGGEWRVEFMPGNTLSFYPPWEAGEYDT